MNTFTIQNHKGFTLIETLFAVLIFSASLVSLMAIAGRGIAAAATAREQITAHYLAQEGLEVVRNIRDRGGWESDFDVCTETDPCHVDYQGGVDVPVLIPCTTDPVNGCPVYENNGAFVDSGTDSGYRRKIYVSAGSPDPNTGLVDEYQVVSRISWKSKNLERGVTMKTLLKNWQ